MPFDGTDQTTLQLMAVKQVLIEGGWCTDLRHNRQGEHCILGALDVVEGAGKDVYDVNKLCIKRLADAIPAEFLEFPLNPIWDVAAFNNTQTGIEPILEWLDRAIG
jgi:hypothetical protein